MKTKKTSLKKKTFAGDTTPTSRDIPDIYISESAEYIF